MRRGQCSLCEHTCSCYEQSTGTAISAVRDMPEFPRILFITPVAFNPHAGGGATFASLFQGWPKDRLATIHNDRAPSPDGVCEHYYFLGRDELDFIPPFNTLRRRDASPTYHDTMPTSPARARWRDASREFVLGDSIPERARLTPELARWIENFRPEVIYTILGSNGMMSLIEQIRARFDLPVVIHFMDDWVSTAHRKGIFAPIERPRMERQLAHFISIATACLGISPAMCEAFSQRYGRAFMPVQYALDRERWGAIAKRNLLVKNTPEICYVGSIFRNAQLNSLIDCAKAVAALHQEGFPLRLRIATSAANSARFGRLLSVHPSVMLDTAGVDDDAFFQGLADADALLLPVNFDRASVDFIRYSMPTKVPAYLNSGTPVLAYGSTETAQIRYATDSRWALVVSEPSAETLKAALKRIVSDIDLREKLSAAARLAAANHDAGIVRASFQQILCQAAGATGNLDARERTFLKS
jgi:glycosyltransferase involved in cell wall biosynthesis